MSTARYFQDELDYLRKSGSEFARFFPNLTGFLSERSTDPDVERLMEGFAFLTARLREKIDDQLPEVTQSLLTLLWPNFLRPVPSMTIMQFSPVSGAISGIQQVPGGAEVDSAPINGISCRFRTAYNVEILPLRVADVRHDTSKEASVITVRMETQTGQDIRTIGLRKLRFYLGGNEYSAMTLNLWLHRYFRAGCVRAADGSELGFSDRALKQGGLRSEEAVLPYPKNAFTGYRILQEFFALPQKFCFLEIDDLPLAHLKPGETGFDLVLEFERPLPPDVRVRSQLFMLHCVPAINLFTHDAEPILLQGRRTEYPVLPARRDGDEIEIFSIEQVCGWTRLPETNSGGISREYSRFESFTHEVERADGRMAVYFRERLRQPLSGQGLERLISFVREDESIQVEEGETISIQLQCSNGAAPAELAIGDIDIPSHVLPSFVRPSNVIRPTEPRYPLMDGTLQWQLISALSLNYLSLQDAAALRTILHTFDFAARVDRRNERTAVRRLEGIESICTDTVDRLFRGLPVRGMRSVIGMRESRFGSEGEMFLFATVLSEFFALFATINSFHELVVHGIEAGEEYRWPAHIGNQPLI